MDSVFTAAQCVALLKSHIPIDRCDISRVVMIGESIPPRFDEQGRGTMAARSAMGFAAGALRQTVTRQTAPQFAPRPLMQQTRAMGASRVILQPPARDEGNPKMAPTQSSRPGSRRPSRPIARFYPRPSIAPGRSPIQNISPNPQAAAVPASRTRASPSTSPARFTSFGRTASAGSPGSGSSTASTRTAIR